MVFLSLLHFPRLASSVNFCDIVVVQVSPMALGYCIIVATVFLSEKECDCGKIHTTLKIFELMLLYMLNGYLGYTIHYYGHCYTTPVLVYSNIH